MRKKNINIILILFALLQLTCHPEKVDDSLIVQPQLLSTQESLKYPPDAFKQGHQGKVVINLLVNKEGIVSKTKILYSSGSDILDEAALKMVQTSIYKPGMIDGVPSDFWIRVPIQFKLGGEKKLSIDLDVWTTQTQEYRKIIKTGTDNEKSNTYKNLYYHYQSLIFELGSSRSITANKGLLTIVDGSIGTPWLKYQDYWPLGFLLFQDYIKRYPESEFAAKSHIDLIRYLKGEIEILERNSYTKPPYTSLYVLFSETLKKLYDQDLK